MPANAWNDIVPEENSQAKDRLQQALAIGTMPYIPSITRQEKHITAPWLKTTVRAYGRSTRNLLLRSQVCLPG